MFEVCLKSYYMYLCHMYFYTIFYFIYLFLEMYTFNVDTLSTFFALHFECEVFSVMEYCFIFFYTVLIQIFQYFKNFLIHVGLTIQRESSFFEMATIKP